MIVDCKACRTVFILTGVEPHKGAGGYTHRHRHTHAHTHTYIYIYM